MEIIGLITGTFVSYYGGPFLRWLFVHKMNKSFKDVYENEKADNRKLSRLILLIFVIIAVIIISL